MNLPGSPTGAERRDFSRRGLAAIAVVLLVLGVGAAAAVSLLTQTFPAVPVSTPPMTGCTSTVASSASVDSGTDGFLTFDCGGGAAAFTVGNQTVTPTFTLPAGYVDLYVYRADADTAVVSCSAITGSVQLISGQPYSFYTTGSGTYNYCADYSNVPTGGLESFSVGWA